MANAFVDTGAQAFANGSINFVSDTIKAALSAAQTLTYDSAGNINNVQFYSDISANVVGTPVALGTKTDAAGVLQAADVTFATVTGSTVVRVWVYKDTGTAGTSQLILAYDTGSGFPIVPTGGNIVVHWDTGAFKIAQL